MLKDRERRIWLTVKVLLDVLLALASFYLAFAYRQGFNPLRPALLLGSDQFAPYLHIFLLAPAIRMACSFMSGLYRPKRGWKKLDAVIAVFKAVALGSLVIVVFIFSYRGIYEFREFSYSRLVILYDFFFNFALVVVSRVAIGYADGWLRKRGVGLKKVLFAGYNSEVAKIAAEMAGNHAMGYRPVGYVGKPAEDAVIPRLGGRDDTAGVLQEKGVDELYVLDSAFDEQTMVSLSEWCEKLDVDMKIIPSMYMILTSGTGIEEVAAMPVISMKRGGIRGWDRVLKDMEDYVLSALGLIVLSPLFAAVAALIKLDSKGSVFYRQERVGKNGKRFMIYKFRSMVTDAEKLQEVLLDKNEAEGPIFKMKHDPRITRVGAFIRKTSIDELPQLINVALGQMSLVGPRPPIPSEVGEYEEWQKERLTVTPGITGLWQISGRSDLTFEEMVKWDIYYIRNWSLWLDLKILLKTVPVVLFRKGAY